MDDFASILQSNYGLKPQGKSAPMTSSKSSGPSPFSSLSPTPTSASIQRTSSDPKAKNGSNRSNRSSNPILGESLDEDLFFGSSNGNKATQNSYGSAPPDITVMYDDVFGGPPKYTTPSYPPMPSQQTASSQSYDDIFRMPVKSSSSTLSSSNKGSSFPVFDAPLYDDDIFGGVPGIRSTNVVYDDVFSGGSTVGTSPSVLEDLLGVSDTRDRQSGTQKSVFDSSVPLTTEDTHFDELLPGFGGTEPAKARPAGPEKSFENSFTGLERNSFEMPPSDPFEGLHSDDPFNVPQSGGHASAAESSNVEAAKGPTLPSGSHQRQYSNDEPSENVDTSGNSSPHLFRTLSPARESRYTSKNRSETSIPAPSYTSIVEEDPVNRNHSSSNGAEMRSSSSPNPVEGAEASSFHSPSRRARQVLDDFVEPECAPKVVESRQTDEYWISVEDVKLVTEPTVAPPPSRRPPLPGMKHGHTSRRGAGSRVDSSFKESSSRQESPQSSKLSSRRASTNNTSNPFEEFEQFASGVSRARKENKMDMSAPTLDEEIVEGSAAASASNMAMKEAMEKAMSKLRVREKEERVSVSRAEETQEELKDAKDNNEEKAHEAEEWQRVREREEREAKAIREKEEREKRRREREKEREREREREREKDRIAVERAAVERATAEARERAAVEARQRAASERVAVDRANAEARERAAAEARERAAVERVTAEARERAAAEARERAASEAREKAAAERATAERAAAEARERAAVEARERAAAERAAGEARARAERAFVERVNAEARERAAEKAAAEARERAAAESRERAAVEARERAAAERAAMAAREQQRRSENDLEAFFAASSRPASVPRQRSPPKSTAASAGKGFSTEGAQRNSTTAASARKVVPTSSTDDWTSLFGPSVSAAGEFQEVEGESSERRRARLDRHQRTAERAAKALDEKNQRDLQSQREQAERHRAGEILDTEIKRWAAGKEGNLRALLSTLQYVLWPECGWQTVSLTDLITAAAVKKVYRKATLCVHPDKVQQKGATIQQKYIAEKVFDLLKEAWNKFNSEELF